MLSRNQLYVLALACCLQASTALAQEGKGDAEPSAATTDTRDEALAELREAQEKLIDVEQQFRSAQGENKEILAAQLDDERRDLLSLVDKQLDSESRSTEASAILASVIRAEWNKSQARAKTAERNLRRLLATRSRKRGEELLQLDDEIHAANVEIDEVFAAIDANGNRRAKLGDESQPEKDFLTEELPKRAAQLSGAIAASQTTITKLEARNASSTAAKEAKDDEIGALQRRLESSIGSLKKTVELLKKYKLEVVEYQQLLIETTGDVTTDILDSDVAVGLSKKYMSRAKAWLFDAGPTLLFKIVLFILIFFLAKLLASVVRRLVYFALGRSAKTGQLFRDQVSGMAARLIVLIGIMIGLWQFGFSPTSILAGLGIVGLVIGLALQSTLSAFAAGTLILLYRPYDIGDLIETNGFQGTVLEMTLMATTLLTLDNQRIVVPNNKVWGEVITNVFVEENRRVDMVFGISYADDIDRAKVLIEEILASEELVLETPESVVHVHELGSSSVDFTVRPWTKSENYWETYWAVTRTVKLRFDAEGISFPFPQRDVHMIAAAS